MTVKPWGSCRDVTRLVLEGEDRRLALRERAMLRMHYWVCTACPPFARQVRLMREAMARWRAYAESDRSERG